MARRTTQLISAGATAAESKANAADLSGAKNIGVYVIFGAGTSAGSVVIETAHDRAYTGAWHTVATIAWSAANKVHYVSNVGPLMALRARVVLATGGTVDVHLVATE